MKRKLSYIRHVTRGSSGLELRSLLCTAPTRKGVVQGKRRTFWFDGAWALIQNHDIPKDNKLTPLMRRAQNRQLRRDDVEDLLSMEPTHFREGGAT